jgi:hypothetical protein
MGFKLLADITTLLSPARQVFFNKKCKIGELIIDLAQKQEINYSNKITEFPIEEGAYISDHVIVRPTKLVLQGSIVDNTFDIVGNVQQITNIFTGNIANNLLNAVKGVSVKQATAYQILQTLNFNKQRVTVVFKLDVFDNMIIEDLTFTNDGDTSNRLFFDITLVQVKQANVETTSITRNISNSNLKNLTSPKSIFGKQESSNATATQESYLLGVAKKIKNWF